MPTDSIAANEFASIMRIVNGRLQQLMRENEQLKAKLGEIQREQDATKERIEDVETHNAVLQNLFVTMHQLHSTADAKQALTTVHEILTNLIGAEVFGIFALAGETEDATLIAHDGLGDAGASRLNAEEKAVLRLAVARHEPWYPPSGDERGGVPTLVPLYVGEQAAGFILIRKLLAHKKELNSVDREIMSLLCNQAAPVIFAAGPAPSSAGSGGVAGSAGITRTDAEAGR